MEQYIENPSVVNVNKLPPRAYNIPDSSQSLNGEWDFNFGYSFSDALQQVQEQSVECKDKIKVPGHWQLQGFGDPIYTNVQFPFPVNPPYAPSNNPTGTYCKHFKINKDKLNPDDYYRLRFDGVDSAYYAFLNGTFIGFSKGSRNPSEFDITQELNYSGDNLLIVVVVQWSDGSYIEDQDQWWLSGIFRDVTIISYNKVGHIEDFALDTANLNGSDAEIEAKLIVEANVECEISVNIKQDTPVQVQTAVLPQVYALLDKTSSKFLSETSLTLSLSNVQLWSAEHPYLYDVEIELKSGGKVLHKIDTYIGVRTTEVTNGRLLINGVPLHIRGVNRHDNSARHGRAVTEAEVMHDLLLMKRNNINAIRCSHYPSHPSLLFLADKLGFYVIDETDLECHGFGMVWVVDTPESAIAGSDPKNLPTTETVAPSQVPDIGRPNTHSRLSPPFPKNAQDFTSDNPDWRDAYLDRVKNMVYRDRIHPSVIMWSLGNESFFGSNHVAMYDYLKENFPRWPVHYEGDNSAFSTTVDVDSVMYPSHQFLEEQGQRTDAQKPLILCEYAHAMGNGPGALDEYVELFNKYERLQGGFVWEWANHGLFKKIPGKPDQEFYGYGGDFGEVIHDGTFVMDGLCDSAHEPTPGLVQLKHVYQPVRFEFEDKVTDGIVNISVKNLLQFVDLKEYYAIVGIEKVARYPTSEVKSKKLIEKEISTEILLSQQPIKVEIGDPSLDFNDYEYIATATLHLAIDKPWADKGHEVAFGQQTLHGSSVTTKVVNVDDDDVKFTVEQVGNVYSITTTEGIHVEVSKSSGKFVNVTNCQGSKVFGEGPKLGFWRAPTDNDKGWDERIWKGYKLHTIEDSVQDVSVQEVIDTDAGRAKSAVKITVNSWLAPAVVQWGIEARITYLLGVRNKTNLEIDTTVELTPKGFHPPHVPRIGLDFVLPDEYENAEWVGRGPGESYPDSKTGCKVGYYESSKDNLLTPYDVPQENGNRSDVRWVSLSSNKSSSNVMSRIQDMMSLNKIKGSGPGKISAVATGDLINFSVQPWTPEQLDEAGHPYELESIPVQNNFRVDFGMHGLGTASCGPGVLDKYKLFLTKSKYSVRFVVH